MQRKHSPLKYDLLVSKLLKDLYSSFWDFLGRSELYGARSNFLHGLLPFPVAIYDELADYLAKILWVHIFQ